MVRLRFHCWIADPGFPASVLEENTGGTFVLLNSNLLVIPCIKGCGGQRGYCGKGKTLWVRGEHGRGPRTT